MPDARAPLVYEVHTRQWLRALSDTAGERVSLAEVPDHVLDDLAAYEVTHLWLMGVWPCGPMARSEALRLPDLRRAYDDALPAWTELDVAGSPYAVSAYTVAEDLGGEAGLAALRARLRTRGIRVLLDFVPNHTGRDHPWVEDRPELFVSADAPFAGSFPVQTPSGSRHLAHGADPFFPPWTDTVQLDHRREDTRRALSNTLMALAERCDGVRCDMAMLVLEDVFAKTWHRVPPTSPSARGDLWTDAISRVKRAHPEFLFLAEAYWDLEERLCAAGFDAAYDKTLYDRIVHDRPADVRAHVLGLGARNARRVHFLENHDEPRVAALLDLPRHRAAALTVLGLPGMRLLHDGQLEGRRRFARVQLARRAEAPQESASPEVAALYQRLLRALPQTAVGRGIGRALDPWPAWHGNPSHQNFILVQWQEHNRDDAFELVVANLGSHRAQCRAPLDARGLTAHTWMLTDVLGQERWVRAGEALAREGLFLDVEAHAAQLFHFAPAPR